MIELEKSSAVSFWCNHIDQYEKDARQWQSQSKKIVKRFKNERKESENGRNKFNILWSNIKTLAPALYDRPPKPNIDRRFQKDDKLGTVSAQVLERVVSFYVEGDQFDDVIKQTVLDRLLSGRGVAWVRYEPKFRTVMPTASEDTQEDGAQVSDDQGIDPDEELASEDAVIDYVHCADFGHTYARTWQEVRAVWRGVQMSRKDLVKRFGEEIGNAVPMDQGKKDDNAPDEYKRSTVYEIWDKDTKKAIWINKNHPEVLDELNDPLKLSNFFPCPKPIYSTLANDGMIPTPDYLQYQDQAIELDSLTARIELLVKALRVAGVYDSSAESIAQLLTDDTENVLIPVTQWAGLGEKGGLKGVIDFLPIKEVGEVLIGLYNARDRTKQELYEITGISDIVRGATDPNETLGAQELKGKYAGLRMGDMQADVARFCRDIVRMFAEIASEHFSYETLRELSGYELLTNDEKMQMQAQMQLMQQSGQPPVEQEGMAEKMENPTWDEVIALLRSNTNRGFRISIETDSTIKQDQDAEKAARTEFLTAAGSFIQQAAQVPVPQLQPLLMEMLKFGVGGFKIGREMETTFDVALKEIKKASENPPQQQEDPSVALEQARLQMEDQQMQQESGIKQAEMQQDAQFKNMELQLKSQELALKDRELALAEQRLALDKYEIDMTFETEKLRIANQPPTVVTQPQGA